MPTLTDRPSRGAFHVQLINSPARGQIREIAGGLQNGFAVWLFHVHLRLAHRGTSLRRIANPGWDVLFAAGVDAEDAADIAINERHINAKERHQ